jgi:hypothetical protein
MIIKHEMYGETYQLSLQFAKYANGQTAIKLWDLTDGFPFATATVCVEDDLLKEDEVAIKDYSENEGLLDALIEAEVVEPPHAFIQSGFVKIPICKLKIVNNF